MAHEFCLKCPTSTYQGYFTCRKSTTWDKRLYFLSEGRRAEDFYVLKIPTASAGFEPANLGTKGQHATSRPSKPLSNTVYELPPRITSDCGLAHSHASKKSRASQHTYLTPNAHNYTKSHPEKHLGNSFTCYMARVDEASKECLEQAVSEVALRYVL